MRSQSHLRIVERIVHLDYPTITQSHLDEAQLRRVLKNYASYYNRVRTHLSLDKNAPDFRRPQKLGPIAAIRAGCITNTSGFRF